jgi:type II secretory pathway component GspD/PulD (secretin)
VGLLFSNKAIGSVNTELVVLITPYILDDGDMSLDIGKSGHVNKVQRELEEQPQKIDKVMDGVRRFEDTLDDLRGKNDTTAGSDTISWIDE